MALLVRSRCGWCKGLETTSRADECVNSGRTSFEFSQRLEGEERKTTTKDKDGGRRQTTNWTSDRPGSIHPDWLSSCGFCRGCSSETGTPRRTRARAPLANPPRPQAVQRQHWMTVWLHSVERCGRSPAISGGEHNL